MKTPKLQLTPRQIQKIKDDAVKDAVKLIVLASAITAYDTFKPKDPMKVADYIDRFNRYCEFVANESITLQEMADILYKSTGIDLRRGD